MVDAKGYWLSVQTSNTQYKSRESSQLNYIVKIHHSESSIVGVAQDYNAAIKAFKEKLLDTKQTTPHDLPEMEYFKSEIQDETANIAMVFLSEYDIEEQA